MGTLTAAGVAVAKFFSDLFRSLPLIAVYIAERRGEIVGMAKAEAEDDKMNAVVQDAYAEIDAMANNEGEWLKEL